MVYKFRSGTTYRGVDANEAGQELERLRQANGGKLPTAVVVEAAKKKSSPIHNIFTWDDTKAAHEYRMVEARHLLREIVMVNGEETPAFVNVQISATESEPAQSYYQSAAVITNTTSEYEAALTGCIARLESAQRSLAEFQKLAAKGKKAKVKRATAHVRTAVEEIAGV